MSHVTVSGASGGRAGKGQGPTFNCFWGLEVGDRARERCHVERFLGLRVGDRGRGKLSPVTVSGIGRGRSEKREGITRDGFWGGAWQLGEGTRCRM